MKFKVAGKLVTVYGGSINPVPTTKRGRRRHEGRSPEQKKHAERCWANGQK